MCEGEYHTVRSREPPPSRGNLNAPLSSSRLQTTDSLPLAQPLHNPRHILWHGIRAVEDEIRVGAGGAAPVVGHGLDGLRVLLADAFLGAAVLADTVTSATSK